MKTASKGGLPSQRKGVDSSGMVLNENYDIDLTVADARWFPTDLDAPRGTLTFTRTDRAGIEELAGLADATWDTTELPKRSIRLREIERIVLGGERPRLNFIWHTAYCCSTLLSRLVDHPDKNLSLREPKVLVTLANAKRAGLFSQRELVSLPDVLFRLLARPMHEGTRVTIKPATAVNYLMREAASLTEGRMLILFSDLASFLASIERYGEQRRGFNRRLFALIAQDGGEQYRWSRDKVFELPDLQIAALVWHMHIAEFRRSLPVIEPGRFASLDCDALLHEPEDVLRKVDEFLDLDLGPERIRAKLDGPLLSRHAKQPEEPYSLSRRQSDNREISLARRRDIEAVVKWSYEVCRTTPLSSPLPNPLVPMDKDYCALPF